MISKHLISGGIDRKEKPSAQIMSFGLPTSLILRNSTTLLEKYALLRKKLTRHVHQILHLHVQ